MNQDQAKRRLLQLEEDVEEFSLVFSGKSSKKANGLYHPDTREIIIHNRNFDNDNALMYTAIHEFAHHIHFTQSPVPVGPRAHTREFRRILHTLLNRAEDRGVYQNIFDTTPEFIALTARIKREFMTKNGDLMKEFGRVLLEADALCKRYNARFEDYVERALSMDRSSAGTIMKVHSMDIDSGIGFENMSTVARIGDVDIRSQAEEAFAKGMSPDLVKSMVRAQRKGEQDPVSELSKEKRRIERTIASLQKKLEEVEERLDELSSSGNSSNIRSFPG
jgi:hypothetical protein